MYLLGLQKRGMLRPAIAPLWGPTRYTNLNSAIQDRCLQGNYGIWFALLNQGEDEKNEKGSFPIPSSPQFSLYLDEITPSRCNNVVSIGRLRTSHPESNLIGQRHYRCITSLRQPFDWLKPWLTYTNRGISLVDRPFGDTRVWGPSIKRAASVSAATRRWISEITGNTSSVTQTLMT